LNNVYVDCQDLSYLRTNSNKDTNYQEENKTNKINNLSPYPNSKKGDQMKNDTVNNNIPEPDIFSFFK